MARRSCQRRFSRRGSAAPSPASACSLGLRGRLRCGSSGLDPTDLRLVFCPPCYRPGMPCYPPGMPCCPPGMPCCPPRNATHPGSTIARPLDFIPQLQRDEVGDELRAVQGQVAPLAEQITSSLVTVHRRAQVASGKEQKQRIQARSHARPRRWCCHGGGGGGGGLGKAGRVLMRRDGRAAWVWGVAFGHGHGHTCAGHAKSSASRAVATGNCQRGAHLLWHGLAQRPVD